MKDNAPQSMVKSLLFVATLLGLSSQNTHTISSESKNLIASTAGCVLGGLIAHFVAPSMSKEFATSFLTNSATSLIPHAVLAVFPDMGPPKKQDITHRMHYLVGSLQMIAPLYSFLQFARKYAKQTSLTETDKSHLKNGIRQLIAIYAAHACVTFGTLVQSAIE